MGSYSLHSSTHYRHVKVKEPCRMGWTYVQGLTSLLSCVSCSFSLAQNNLELVGIADFIGDSQCIKKLFAVPQNKDSARNHTKTKLSWMEPNKRIILRK